MVFFFFLLYFYMFWLDNFSYSSLKNSSSYLQIALAATPSTSKPLFSCGPLH